MKQAVKRALVGSVNYLIDDGRHFRQRFPDFEFTDFVQGISEAVEYYQVIL